MDGEFTYSVQVWHGVCVALEIEGVVCGVAALPLVNKVKGVVKVSEGLYGGVGIWVCRSMVDGIVCYVEVSIGGQGMRWHVLCRHILGTSKRLGVWMGHWGHMH
jgi:hypothetical protein